MAANSDAVDGTKVAGSTSISGGAEHQNGAFLTSADDIATINAAQQSALTIPDDRGTRRGRYGKMYGAYANPAHTALPSGAKDGGY